MTKLRRLRILKVILKLESQRTKFMHFRVSTLTRLNGALIYLNYLVQKIRGAYLRRQTADLIREFDPILKKCQQINSGNATLTQAEKDLVLAAGNNFSVRSQPLVVRMQRQLPIVGRGVILYSAQSLERKHLGNMRKFEVLKHIMSQKIDDPTFYYALLLWFVVPTIHVDSCLGDLDEEYELRRRSVGEEIAKAWYQSQVVSSVQSCLWARLERIVAIGSLIEWIFNFSRKQH